MNAVLFITIAAAVILTLLYFRLSWLVRWIEKIPKIDRFIGWIRVLDDFNATILLRILSLSIARYAVFIGQYYLLFAAFSGALKPAAGFGVNKCDIPGVVDSAHHSGHYRTGREMEGQHGGGSDL